MLCGALHRRDQPQQPLGRAVGWMVRRVARRLPFQALCLPQAMAAQWMLRRRGVPGRLRVGVRRSSPERPLEYQVWLTVGSPSSAVGPRGVAFRCRGRSRPAGGAARS